MDIGEKIRSARIAKGMTQEELGNHLGVQKSAIAKYENGRVVNIKRSTLKKISDVLGIRPAELIGENEEQKPVNEDGLTESQRMLIDFSKSLSEDQAVIALRVLKSIVGDES